MSNAVETRIEKTQDSRRRGITTYTLEMVGATRIDEIQIPGKDSQVRNIRRSLADGRATLTFDRVDESVGDGYTISGTASQEPLATHPHFQPEGKWAVEPDEWKIWDKWQKEGTDLAAENLTEYSEGFQKFIKLYLSGFTDYLQPRVTIRVVDAKAEEPDLSELGKIAEPAQAPTLADGANWLMTGMDASKDLSIDDEDGEPAWEVTREFMSSGPGGWNADIYGAGAGAGGGA
jgi:hypothetical protein